MNGRLLGPDGRPLTPDVEQNLQLLIDTAVETKVNTAIDHLREDLRTQHYRDSVTTRVRYGALIVINVLIAITLYFISPDLVRDWTRQFVADNMNRLMLQEAADEIMHSRMEAYINDEFAKVEARVRAVTEKLDSLSKDQEFIAKLTEELSAKTNTAETKLQDINATLASARSQLQEIDKITEFTRTVIAAQNDGRRAFDQLETWANDAAFPMREEALASYRTVLDEHSQPMYLSGFTVPWKEGVDPAKMNLTDLRQNYQSAPNWLKPALIEYTWKRDEIPKKEKMAFLADVLAHDRSLKAVEYAGRFLSEALDAKLKPLAVKPLLQVWEEKKPSIQ